MIQAGENMDDVAVSQFAGEKYLCLETYRKTGAPVRTPVWFAPDDKDKRSFYVYTLADSGKVKRIRNNTRVRVAPCSMRGMPKGVWVDAEARIVDGTQADHGQRLLSRKYWMKRVGDLFSRLRKRKQVVIAIRLSQA